MLIFDEDLAYASGLPAASAGARDFDLEDMAVLLAFFLDIFHNFYRGISKRSAIAEEVHKGDLPS